MKIALFSDIHGNLTALKAVLSALDDWGGADVVFAAGDLIGGGPGTDEIIEILSDRNVHMVRGDSDTEGKLQALLAAAAIPQEGDVSTRWSAAYYAAMQVWMRDHLSSGALAFLAALPLSERLEVAPGHHLLVCHASPRAVDDRVCAPDNSPAVLRAAYGLQEAVTREVDVIAFGHAHTPYVRLLDGKLMVNVASVAFRSDATSVLTMLSYFDEQWLVQQRFVPYDAAAEERLMQERGVPTVAMFA